MKSHKKQKISQKMDFFRKHQIGVNSHVFDDEKSNKSTIELIRPSCVAILAFSAIFEQI